jgi:hypothetical protein
MVASAASGGTVLLCSLHGFSFRKWVSIIWEGAAFSKLSRAQYALSSRQLQQALGLEKRS